MEYIQTKNQKIYTCPMHPEVRRDTPGICPECGMNLVQQKNKSSYAKASEDKHAGHSTEMFLRKFWISLILTVPIVVYSDIFEIIFGFKAPEFFGSEYLVLTLGSIVFFYGGLIFIKGAYRELKAKLPGMMTLIALAISTAFIYSIYATISGSGDDLFWELTTLITVMLLGHYIEMRAVGGAQSALKELSKLLPDTAEIISGDKNEIVPLSELKEGDIVLVRPGGKIPADGIVIEGESETNESMITGESKLVGKKEGSGVIAGTINGDGSLKVKVSRIGEHTFLSGVMRLVAEAQASKSRLQMLSDRAAFYLTIIAVFAGGFTFAAWLVFADATFAINRMVAVLVIACPHALGLAIPLVASIGTTKAAKNGFLVKQRLSLEAARSIDIILFDKTGTLTRGEFGVDRIIPEIPGNETELLQYAFSVNIQSEHPLAKAMVNEAKNKGVAVLEAKNFQRIPGKGVKANIGDEEIFVGSISLAEDRRADLSLKIKKETEALSKQGKTINIVIKDDKTIGAIALVDIIREESREAIKNLREMGIKTAMITGDSDDVAKWVAKELNIDEYFAKVLPEQKSEKVKILQGRNQKVAMVGDGVNDAPALAQSDLGIAIGAGTNVAIESAGIILVRNDPRDIVKIIKLSKLTYAKMIQNLFWATGYNIVALPLAAGILYSYGIILQPALAAVFMSLSTVIVAINALFLKYADLG